MAYISTDRLAGHGADVSGLAARIADWRARLAAWRLYRRTLRELNALGDRDLADLGMSRAALRGIAWQAVYGK